MERNLADNNISTLHRASLQPAQRLWNLELSGNPLEAVGSGAFGALPDLRRLALSRCRLRRLPAHALRPLENLHQLVLDGNELTELEPEAWAPLRNLVFLSLGGNRLRRVPAHALRHLTNLTTLSVSLESNLINAPIDSDAGGRRAAGGRRRRPVVAPAAGRPPAQSSALTLSGRALKYNRRARFTRTTPPHNLARAVVCVYRIVTPPLGAVLCEGAADDSNLDRLLHDPTQYFYKFRGFLSAIIFSALTRVRVHTNSMTSAARRTRCPFRKLEGQPDDTPVSRPLHSDGAVVLPARIEVLEEDVEVSIIVQRTKLCRSELATGDIMRRCYAPRPFLPLRRVPILSDCDAFVTKFTAAKFRALYCIHLSASSSCPQHHCV
ncbi:Leucine-rich repeat-containing G-protein coupled receptor 5 [Eumeta japonica]|uniref:Leucine-rich repeat-containing G-protein coupled receptor 5 n=1 Tax=Eumeta variegata TaxID=151549 RepID=A0A4C1WTR7_EUMVA|nr:Leucine-rich repeat-containing G-protein coupled receptor 5 [Eumeta japonica]